MLHFFYTNHILACLNVLPTLSYQLNYDDLCSLVCEWSKFGLSKMYSAFTVAGNMITDKFLNQRYANPQLYSQLSHDGFIINYNYPQTCLSVFTWKMLIVSIEVIDAVMLYLVCLEHCTSEHIHLNTAHREHSICWEQSIEMSPR